MADHRRHRLARLDDVVDGSAARSDTVVRLEVLPADSGPTVKHGSRWCARRFKHRGAGGEESVIELPDGNATRRIGVISLPTFYQDFDARRRGERDYKERHARR